MKKTLTAGGLTLILLGAIAWFYHSNTKTTASGPTVITFPVQNGQVVQTFTATGAVAAVNQVTVYAPVGGVMGQTLPKVGDTVTAGETLAMQPDESLTNQLTADKAALQNAELNLAQVKATAPDVGAITTATAAFSVKSPLSGAVVSTNVSPGQQVKAGTVLATLNDTQVVTVQAQLPDYEVGGLRPGQTVQIDLLGSSFTGQIQSVGAANTAGDVTVSVQGNRVGSMQSGMSGALSFYPDPQQEPYWNISGQGTVGVGPNQNLVSTYDGTVTSFPLAAGDTVSEGEAVATIQSTDPASLQAADLQVQEAQAKVSTDEGNLGQLSIDIPVSGVVTAITTSPGQLVSTGASILTVVDPKALEVTVPVDEVDIDKLHVGQKATITAPAVPGKVFPAVIQNISPVGTNSNGVATFPVTVTLQDTQGLETGMTAVANFTLASGQGLTVPLPAIQRRGTRAFVLVSTPKGQTPVMVRIGLESDTRALVTGNLNVGDQVVVASVADAQQLQNGNGRGGFGMLRMGGGGGRPDGGGGASVNRSGGGGGAKGTGS